MPPRKKLPPVERPAAQVRVRVEPYFAVRVLSDSDGRSHAHALYTGPTARAALQAAKNELVARDHGREVALFVVNGSYIEAIGWTLPTYPGQSDEDPYLLDRVMRVTGGVLLD